MNSGDKNHLESDSFEGQFEEENKLREKLTKDIANCKNRQNLIDIVSKYQTLPGTESGFNVSNFLEELKLQESMQALDYGKDADTMNKQKERYALILRQATRSFGLRKKWAEILGVKHLFDEVFFNPDKD